MGFVLKGRGCSFSLYLEQKEYVGSKRESARELGGGLVRERQRERERGREIGGERGMVVLGRGVCSVIRNTLTSHGFPA